MSFPIRFPISIKDEVSFIMMNIFAQARRKCSAVVATSTNFVSRCGYAHSDGCLVAIVMVK